jgi:hypothetical protein
VGGPAARGGRVLSMDAVGLLDSEIGGRAGRLRQRVGARQNLDYDARIIKFG